MVTASEGVVPVLDDGRLVGLLSWDRALAAFAGETPQHTIPKRCSWLFWM
jgi:putative methionine-R-sulfoxide reductase with GAF domain